MLPFDVIASASRVESGKGIGIESTSLVETNVVGNSSLLVRVADVRNSPNIITVVVTEVVVRATTVKLGRLTTVGPVTVTVATEFSLAATIKSTGEIVRGVEIMEGSVANIALSLLSSNGLNENLNTSGTRGGNVSTDVLVDGITVVNEQSTLKGGTIGTDTSTTRNSGLNVASGTAIAIRIKLGLATVTRIKIAISPASLTLVDTTSTIKIRLTIDGQAAITPGPLKEVTSNRVNLSTSNGNTVDATIFLGSLATISPVQVLISAKVGEANARVAITIRSLVVNRSDSNTLGDLGRIGAVKEGARELSAVHANTPTTTIIIVEVLGARVSTASSLRNLTTIMGEKIAIVVTSNTIEVTSGLATGELITKGSVELARGRAKNNMASSSDLGIGEHQAIERSESGNVTSGSIVGIVVSEIERRADNIEILVEERKILGKVSNGLTLSSSRGERTSASTDTGRRFASIAGILITVSI